MPLAVNDPSDEIKSLACEWDVLEPLMAGTRAMRAASVRLLPKWPNEEQSSYDARLAVATLFPAYRRTVGVMAGKPFAKSLTLSEDAPASVKAWSEDIDRQGVNLHAFAAEMFEKSFYGLAGILVDYPDTRPRDENGKPVSAKPEQRTVAQVEASGARPYFVRVMHRQILGWRTASEGGAVKLAQLRLLESIDEPDGPYGTVSVPHVRVLEPGRWELWRAPAANDGNWVKVDEGTTSLDYIPFVTLYGRREGYMCGSPTLLDLAYLNVKHWQSQSDQDTIEHVARVPILCISGADEKTELTVGAASAVTLPQGGEMSYVEHTGAAIKAGADSLVRLEDQMIQTGAELLVKKPGDRSATESAGDQEGNKCDLQRLTEQMEDALDAALQMMADYARLPKGGSVSLFKDFGAATLSDASAQLVADLNSRGLLTRETTLREMQRRGVIEASVDVKAEIEKAEQEGPALGELSVAMSGDAARAALAADDATE